MDQGQFQIYDGDGKGKTTAAVGLAVRALGAGLKVYLGQFIKDMEYHEIKILKQIPGMTVELYGNGMGCLIGRYPSEEDLAAARKGVEKAMAAIKSGEYDMVILDEINVAWKLGLLKEEDMLELAGERPSDVELIFTGRGCPESVMEKADLITEMKEVRHYYSTKGLLARDGIER